MYGGHLVITIIEYLELIDYKIKKSGPYYGSSYNQYYYTNGKLLLVFDLITREVLHFRDDD